MKLIISFIYLPVSFSLVGPKVFVSTRCQTRLAYVRNEVPYPYNTIGKAVVLDSIIVMFLDSKREDKR
jgi:hypothetical protein